MIAVHVHYIGEGTFGNVSWCKIDIENALREHNYSATQDMIDLIYEKCNNNHYFTSKMIDSGWEAINYYIHENKNELDSLSIK